MKTRIIFKGFKVYQNDAQVPVTFIKDKDGIHQLTKNGVSDAIHAAYKDKYGEFPPEFIVASFKPSGKHSAEVILKEMADTKGIKAMYKCTVRRFVV